MNGSQDLISLIQGIQQGNELAFRQLYNQTKSWVFNLTLSYVHNREDAEEITQDVFIEVFRSANAFKGDANVVTWLYRITVNKSLDFLKYKKRQKRFAFLTSLFNTTGNETLHQSVDFVHPL